MSFITKNKSHEVIGMLHLPALPGAPLNSKSIREISECMISDAKVLVEGGVDALMMENFGDVPFYPGLVPSYVVANMTAIALNIRNAVASPLGINVLRNDGLSAISIAHAVGAEFIRVNVLCGARVTDQGMIQGIAHDLMRLKRELGASSIKVLADVDVKHSAALAPRPLSDEVEDTIKRGLADALVVSGSGTGKSVDLQKLKDIRSYSGDTSIFIGSGVTESNIVSLMPYASGFIVGTSLKKNGQVSQPVERERVQRLVQKIVKS
jgi:uncharacterized protein